LQNNSVLKIDAGGGVRAWALAAQSCHHASGAPNDEMARQNSESQLAGRLAASLTPRVSQLPLQHRGEQSSGLLDLGVLYSASVQQVMERARLARDAPTVVELLDEGEARRPNRARRRPQRPSFDPRFEDVQALEAAGVLPVRGVGWFGVAVAWLVTAVVGVTLATTVPAHAVVLGRLPATAVAPSEPSVSHPAAPVVQAVQQAAQASPATASVESLPVATASTSTPVAHPATTALKVPTRVATGSSPERMRPAPARADAPPSTERAATPPTPSSKAAAEVPIPKAAPANPSPTPASDPLVDLMRRAVEADSKHH
jgi:hypothetical protein